MTKKINLGVWDDAEFFPRIEGYNPQEDKTGAVGMALAERAYREAVIERDIHKIEEKRKYAVFLERAGNLRDSDDMREALIAHFPGRFGKGGSQPIPRYDPDKVFGLYKSMVRYAKSRLGR
jgi:hypothetical protein